MRKETKQLFSTSTIYSIGNILVKLVAFVLIPLYARKLAPDEYGIVAILELVENLGKTIFVFGLSQSILRFLVHYRKQKKLDELVFSIAGFLFLANVILLGVLYWFPDPLVRHLLVLNPENIFYFRTILIVIFCGVFQAIFVTLLQGEEKAFKFIIFTIVNFLLLIGLNIYKVGILDQGIRGIVESKLYVSLLNLILIALYLFYRFRPRFSAMLLKESINYGAPLTLVGISLTILTLADRFLLKILGNFSDVGIYSMAYRFGMILNMVLVTPFRQAFFPLMFRLAEQHDVKQQYRKFFTYFLFCGLWLFLAISVFAKELLIIATSAEYVEGYIVIPLIAFSYLLFGVRTLMTTALAAQDKTPIIAYSTIIGAAANIVLNLLMIPQWGYFGAAMATLFSYLFIFVTTYYPLQKFYPINWDWRRAQKLVFATLSLYFITFLIPELNLYLSIMWKSILFLLFPIILYLIKFFQNDEIEIIKNFVKLIARKIL